MEITKELLDVGLTRNEISVYKVLLEVGAKPVSVISKRVSINRTTVYSVLKSIKEKGLISSYQADGVEVFLANNPNSIVGYIDRKVKALDYYRCSIIRNIPKIRSVQQNYLREVPLVRHFSGLHGVGEVMDDAMSAGELLIFSPMKDWKSGLIGEFLLRYMSFRTMESRVRIITLKTKESVAFFKDHFKRNGQIEVKFLSEKDKNGCSSFENSVKIYQNKVSMVNVDGEKTHGVIIESSGIASSHKYLFETLWKNIK